MADGEDTAPKGAAASAGIAPPAPGEPLYGAPRPQCRYVLLATSAAVKVREYKALLDKYGIEVAQAPAELWDGEAAAEAQARAFADPKCIAVLRDQAHLLAGSEGEAAADPAQLSVARSRVRLSGRTARGEAFDFEDTIFGFNDPSLKRPEGDAFGWDDTFVNMSTGRTLFAGSGSGAAAGHGGNTKISSRDAVVSRYISKYVHYKQRVDLAHAADLTHMAETIDFSFDPARFVAKHPLLSKGLAVPGYGNMLRAVLDGGLLFRSAANRRERNWWMPGLNAGIPLTPKKDPVHEATFMAHDFGHFLVPDLVFTGSPLACSKEGRRLYIVYRMLSEAVTMIMADQLYVEGLRLIHGVEYDWKLRKIHPLLAHAEEHTGEKLLLRAPDAPAPTKGSSEGWAVNVPFLHRLIAANVAFCLRGDEARWRELMGTATRPDAEAAFTAYKVKYAPFFVADYSWTAQNYAGMAESAAFFRDWWASSGHMAGTVQLDTIDSYAAKLGPGAMALDNEGFTEAVWEHAWETTLRPVLGGPSPPAGAEEVVAPRPLRFYRAFTRYLLGQMALFAKHPGCHLTAPVRSALHAAHARAGASQSITDEEVRSVRGVYGEFVDELVRQLRITPDDGVVFKDTLPLFEPFYVSYDARPDSYEAIPTTFRLVFG